MASSKAQYIDSMKLAVSAGPFLVAMLRGFDLSWPLAYARAITVIPKAILIGLNRVNFARNRRGSNERVVSSAAPSVAEIWISRPRTGSANSTDRKPAESINLLKEL